MCSSQNAGLIRIIGSLHTAYFLVHYSIYVKFTGVDPSTLPNSYALVWLSTATDSGFKLTGINTLSENVWQRVSQPFKFITNVPAPEWAHIYEQSLRFELTSNLPDGASISFATMKLEKGTTATPYSQAPEDILK